MSDKDNPPFRIKTTSLGVAGEMHRLEEEGAPRRSSKAYASFQIFGPALVPQRWSRYFGCAPSASHLQGDSFGPDGEEFTESGAPWARHREGMWSLESRDHVADDQLDPHIDHLAARLGLPRPDLAALIAAEGASCRVFCFWDNSAGDRVPVVRPATLAVLRESGAVLEVDEYPQTMTTLDGRKIWV